MALRIIERPSGPVLVDDELVGPGPPPTTRLELIAEEVGLDPDTYRDLLREEIQRRRVAPAGDSPEAPPRHHRHRI